MPPPSTHDQTDQSRPEHTRTEQTDQTDQTDQPVRPSRTGQTYQKRTRTAQDRHDREPKRCEAKLLLTVSANSAAMQRSSVLLVFWSRWRGRLFDRRAATGQTSTFTHTYMQTCPCVPARQCAGTQGGPEHGRLHNSAQEHMGGWRLGNSPNAFLKRLENSF